MKKFFAWALVLAMVLTMMPVMDDHNHAHAATVTKPVCTFGTCDNRCEGIYTEDPASPSYAKRCICGHKESYHKVREVIVCDHLNASNDGDCTNFTTCPECFEVLAHPKDAHVPGPDDNNCTTPILCSNPGCTQIAKAGFAHTREDDGDCTTADDCSVCGMEDVFAAGTHTADEDDGDCTTPILCKICDQITTPAKEHTPAADDGDCTTPILCANTGCEEVMTAGKAHTPEADDGDCTTAIVCSACGTVTTPAAASHTPKADDGDCSTPVECSVCGMVTTEAASTHNLVNGECTNCEFKCKHTATTKTTTKEANCKEEGTEVETCDACGVVVGTVALPIDEDNHKWVVFPFGAGYCVRCNEVNVNYDDFEDVLPDEDAPIENPCDEHEWAHLEFGAWYCTKCGASATDIKPLEPEICDHADTYINVIKPATCKKEGSAEEICDICETVLDANVVLPIDKENGHDLVIFPFGASWCNLCHEINVDYEDFIEPENPQDSCDHEWISFPFGVWLCPKCMLQTEEDPTVPVEPEEPKYCENNEHQWASLAFGAWYCTKCGLHATDIKPLDPDKCDHADTYIDVTTPATCVATGIGNKMCDICETVMEEGVEVAIDPDAHQWGTDANGNACCLLCGLYESELPEEEPCEHEWAAVATGWYCWKCNSVTLDNPFATEPVVLLGDVNDDGVVDGRDEVRLMKYLVGQDVHINKLNADLNGDGVIDGRDEIRLLYRLL